ncbi:NUDIX domain-containing protein [Patescibacteria group bacterium]|nr:MAG: NUDIX domain-containing protein [Patescibacteria group bacterium]
MPFEICARAVMRHRGKILVCLSKKSGIYFFPGGHIEFGEAAGEALKRELAEELGVKLKKFSYIGTVENIYEENNELHHEINLVFDCAVDKAHNQSQEDHIDFVLLDDKEFTKIMVLPLALQKSVIKWLKNKKTFWSSETA